MFKISSLFSSLLLLASIVYGAAQIVSYFDLYADINQYLVKDITYKHTIVAFFAGWHMLLISRIGDYIYENTHRF